MASKLDLKTLLGGLPRNDPPREWKPTDQALACKCKDGYDNLAHLKGPVSITNPDCWGKTCPDGTNCNDAGNGVTCCPNLYGSYGCCMVGNATCCPDKMNCAARVNPVKTYAIFLMIVHH